MSDQNDQQLLEQQTNLKNSLSGAIIGGFISLLPNYIKLCTSSSLNEHYIGIINFWLIHRQTNSAPFPLDAFNMITTDESKFYFLLFDSILEGLSKNQLISSCGDHYLAPEQLSPRLALAINHFWSTNSFLDGWIQCTQSDPDDLELLAIYGQLAGAYWGLTGIPDELLVRRALPSDLINYLTHYDLI